MAGLIEFQGITKRFGSSRGNAIEVIGHFDLTIQTSELVCLLGPSGCGKSTVLNMAAGFEAPSSGAVLVRGQPVVKPGPDRTVVFQEPLLFPWLNVLDNVTFGPRMGGDFSGAMTTRALTLLAQVGLATFEKHRIYELSGGMRQRVAIARAWIMNPEILLMDEPFGALDAQTRLTMQELLVALWEKERQTTLFVTHDIDEALYIADRICVMSGRPSGVKMLIDVPFPRPRTYENTLSHPDYAELKRLVLASVREASITMM